MPKARDLAILLVEDQMSMRLLARQALQAIGFTRITEARSGRDAMAVLEKDPINLILSDWNMEDIDGLTLLKMVRKHPKTGKTPFIMLTGNADREKVKEAIEAGVSNYIVKPVDVITMRKRIEMVIGPIEA